MAANRKKSFEVQEKELLSFPAFKHGETLSRAVENMVFNSDVAVSVNLEKSFAMVIKWKNEKKEQSDQQKMNRDENYDCKCLGPTEKEIENARKRYWHAKQKKSRRDEKIEVNVNVSSESSKWIPKEPKLMTSPVLPRNILETVQNMIKKAEIKPEVKKPSLGFTSAREECLRQAAIRNRAPPAGVSTTAPSNNPVRVRRYMGNRLVTSKPHAVFKDPAEVNKVSKDGTADMCEDERLKGIDPKLLDRLKIDVLAKPSSISWNDIKGLEFAKETMMEAIVYPLQRPDLFTGLRRPPKGVLMFGPPGTGKTLIAKCVANNAKATFFNVSASTLTSKWVGEGEMMVRALFTYARVRQPSVIFIDEVDCLLSQRSNNEHESSRRLKTEFLVFLDGCGTGDSDQVLLIGATNRPQELDEAARRRFTKRLYIPLPEKEARYDIIKHYLKEIEHNLGETEIECLSAATDGFSGADLKVVAETAGFMPMRDMIKKSGAGVFNEITKKDIPPVTIEHWKRALKGTRPSVSKDDLEHYIVWNKKFGSNDGD